MTTDSVPTPLSVVSPTHFSATSDQVNITDKSLTSEIPSYSGSTVLSSEHALTDQTEMSEVSADAPGDGPWQVVRHKRLRCGSQGSTSSTTTVTSATPSIGLVVLFTPSDSNVAVKRFNSLKLSEALDSLSPSCILQIRVNTRRNIIAVDCRNSETSRALLRLTSLCGVPIRAFEPRQKTSSVGTVRGVDESISDTALLTCMKSTFPIRSVRRLGTSRTIRVEFASPTLPQHVFVGLVRHAVELHIPNSVQCFRCGGFGHVKASCVRAIVCLRCGKSHATDTCTATELSCVNCGKSHEATSKLCSRWQQERSVCRYSTEHNVSFRDARTAVCAVAGLPTVPSVRAHITPDAAQAFPVVRQPPLLPPLVPPPLPAQPRPLNTRPSTVDDETKTAGSAANLSEVPPATKMVPPHPTIRRSYRDTLRSDPNGSRLSQTVPSRASLLQEQTPEAWSWSKFVQLMCSMFTHLLTRIASPWARTVLNIIQFVEPLITSIV